jgi:hypothetical protein
LAVSSSEVTAELTLQNAVHAFDFLFFAQLQSEVRGTLTRGAAVLAWLAVEFALIADRAACALQEQVGAFTA